MVVLVASILGFVPLVRQPCGLKKFGSPTNSLNEFKITYILDGFPTFGLYEFELQYVPEQESLILILDLWWYQL